MSRRWMIRVGAAMAMAAMGTLFAGCGDDDGQPTCGDGRIEGAEQCDASELGGATCTSIAGGFTGGTLSCSSSCTFDTSACGTAPGCGNGTLDTGEDCDGAEMGTATCDSVGNFVGGTLGCATNCTFDTTQCTPPLDCGNGDIDTAEDCDGTNLGGRDCAGAGEFLSGTLTCGADCSFNTTNCVPANVCGNGVQEGTEQCDGGDLASTTCATVGGFVDGTLDCNNNCTFDTDLCHTCGDGVQDTGEDCDGDDFGTTTCRNLGTNVGGELGCTTGCTIDASACEANYPVGALVITEIMKNPVAVSDSVGEWIEVYNGSVAAVDLEGIQIQSDGDTTHVIQPGGPLLLAPGAYAVLGRSTDSGLNGGVTVDYAYSGISLANDLDRIALANPSGVLIDEVTYDSTDFPWYPGFALSLDRDHLSATDNDDPANWCDSSARIGLDWDHGSPGVENPSCTPETACNDNSDNDGNGREDCADPACAYDGNCSTAGIPGQGDLAIVEMMIQPTGTESLQEWLEIENVSGHALELNGLHVCYGDYVCFVLDYQQSEVLSAGGRALITASGNPSLNGGIQTSSIEYVSGPVMNLPNVIGRAALLQVSPGQSPELIDLVEWDTTGSWQVTAGVALQFNAEIPATTVDNDDPANWCDARGIYGTAGMSGTPGEPNEQCLHTSGNLFFSEYVEGSGLNKALEIYNGGTTWVALENCEVIIRFGGSTTVTTITLDATPLGPDQTWVVCDDGADQAMLDVCDQTDTHNLFNGDDSIELNCDGSTLDVFGQIGTDPGDEWNDGTVRTQNQTLVRMCSVTTGDTDGTNAFLPSVEWQELPEDTFDELGLHCP